MKKISLLTLCTFFLISFYSCKKSKTEEVVVATNDYFLDVTIGGQTYTSKIIGIFGSTNQTGCDTKKYVAQNIGQIDIAKYFIQVDIKHKENQVDFANSTSGNYSVKDNDILIGPTYGNSCNLDLEISVDDLMLSNENTKLQSSGRIHTVSSVTKVSENSTSVKYNITGTFSCSVKNSANILLPITGKYKTFIETLK